MLSITLPSISILISSLILSATAQDLSGLPQCGITCSQTAIASIDNACTSTDFTCLCKNKDFVANANSCYQSTCQGDDLSKALKFGAQICAQVGVDVAATATANGISTAANSTTNAVGNAGNATANAAAGIAGRITNATTANNNNSTVNRTTSPINNGSAPGSVPNSATQSTPAFGFFVISAAMASLIVLS